MDIRKLYVLFDKDSFTVKVVALTKEQVTLIDWLYQNEILDENYIDFKPITDNSIIKI